MTKINVHFVLVFILTPNVTHYQTSPRGIERAKTRENLYLGVFASYTKTSKILENLIIPTQSEQLITEVLIRLRECIGLFVQLLLTAVLMPWL